MFWLRILLQWRNIKLSVGTLVFKRQYHISITKLQCFYKIAIMNSMNFEQAFIFGAKIISWQNCDIGPEITSDAVLT